jgi:hypothetical protein
VVLSQRSHGVVVVCCGHLSLSKDRYWSTRSLKC